MRGLRAIGISFEFDYSMIIPYFSPNVKVYFPDSSLTPKILIP